MKKADKAVIRYIVTLSILRICMKEIYTADIRRHFQYSAHMYEIHTADIGSYVQYSAQIL